jgi:predicted membrane channel-forming protein YqfA (hemolysin III family)
MLNIKKYNNYNTFNNSIKQSNNKLIYNLTRNEVPIFLKEKYIYTGYRLNGDYYQCLLSLFKLHNETLNAWTMIIGSIISSYYLYYYMNILKFNCFLDKIPFYYLWLSSILHMPLSVGNHLFLCINKKTFVFWKKIDLIGIFFVSVLLTFGFSYFVFKNPFITIYLTLFSFILYSIATILISNRDYDQGIEKFLHTIGISFIVIIYLIPIIINTIYDYSNFNTFLEFIYNSIYFHNSIIIIGSLLLGAIIFILQIPEKYYPYTFDIIGNSHQLMHLTLIIAHIAEYKFLELIYINYKSIYP